MSEIVRHDKTSALLDHYLSDRVPGFYQTFEDVQDLISKGYFLSAMHESLARLPEKPSFRESHFGEIVSAIMAEEVLGWRLLYSKLTLTTAENENPKKIDLALYDPSKAPVEFIFGSVKSSPKSNKPANHHKSCYPDLFRSFTNYSAADEEFDIAAARRRLALREPDERARVKAALMPYGKRTIRYCGFSVIDSLTRCDIEMEMLWKRHHQRPFDVEVLCIEGFESIAGSVYEKLDGIKNRCLP